MGKTSCILAIIKILKKLGMMERAIIVAPLRVCHLVWPAEQYDWTDFHELKMVVLHGPNKEALLNTEADIYVINPEGLKWLVEKAPNSKKSRLINLDADMLVVDESSKFKNTQSARFKMLKPNLGKFARRYTLTGTPSPNGYEDVFGQIYVTDMGNALGQYITHYRNEYFDSTGFGGYTYKLKEGAEKRIQKKLKPLVLRLDAEDFLQLPEIINNVIRFDLPPDARKVYDRLEEDMFAMLDNGKTVTAPNAAAASGKCAQVANGALYYDDDVHGLLVKPSASESREWAEVHAEKTTALEDLVEELGGKPLLIGYEYNHDLARLQKLFGKNLPYIGGGVSTKKALAIAKAWNAGELPVLAGHPASMGHGLNMQGGGNDVAWFSITWDYELYDQFIKRVRRQGNRHETVRVHHFVARNTIDEAKLQALSRKKNVQQGLLDALRSYRKIIAK